MAEVVSGMIPNHEKCIKQLALNVVRNAKFLSNPLKVSLFTAKNATERKEDFSSVNFQP